MTTMFVDLANGNDSNDGLTFSNRKLTIASAVTALGSGEHEVRVMRSPAPTDIGQTATWTDSSAEVMLTSAVTANIDTCDAAWTASANVTATASTSVLREGTASANLAIGTAFTTGLAAYRATGTLDLSAYEQVSFLVRHSAALSGGVYELRLCSDAAGVTAVHTIPIPALESGQWTPVVWDNGAALSSSIQSIALYVITDPGFRTLNVDNVIACKASSSADCITHTSLISTGSSDDGDWYGLRSINGTSLFLNGGYHSLTINVNVARYFGTTGAKATYVRSILTTALSSISSVSGTSSAAPFLLTGGWDVTAMTTQESVTWLRSLTNAAQAFVFSGCNDWVMDGICFAYGRNPATTAGVITLSQCRNFVIDRISAAACMGVIRVHQAPDGLRVLRGGTFAGCYVCIGTSSTGAGCVDVVISKTLGPNLSGTSVIEDASTYGLSVRAKIGTIKDYTYGVKEAGGQFVRFYDSDFANGVLAASSSRATDLYAENCTFNGFASWYSGVRSFVYATRHEGSANDHRIYDRTQGNGGLIQTDASVRHTESDVSWMFSFQAEFSSTAPLAMGVAAVACNAGESRTVKLWMRRSLTSLSGRLRVRAVPWAGITASAYADLTAAVDTWEEVSVTFTPTANCVAEVYAEAWVTNVAALMYVDDFSVT